MKKIQQTNQTNTNININTNTNVNKHKQNTNTGTPLRGLIQDHVDFGILLTHRDTFFTKSEFQQLVYSACLDINASTPFQ